MSALLSVRDLAIDFQSQGSVIEAVRGVSFDVASGSTLALVGESGSGKSVVSQAIMGILPRNGQITRGSIAFDDPETEEPPVEISALAPESRRMREIRGSRISLIFQEPMSALSPVHTIGNQVTEALRLHRAMGRAEARARTIDMLRLAGFPEPEQALDRYPFELSGGLRQRAMIAMALICRPSLLIADEPTTALDVTIQAQILKLIADLQEELGMAVLIITHDLGVVANLADDVVVMYHGQVMEAGPRDEIYRNPSHPYLKALLRAVPRFHMPRDERLEPIREIRLSPGPMLSGEKKRQQNGAGAGGINAPLMTVRNVSKSFGVRRKGFLAMHDAPRTAAVKSIDFDLFPGECLGLVGESGSGKTTLARILMRDIVPDAGEVRFQDGTASVDVMGLKDRSLHDFRKRVQFIFQDPFSALNPRMTVFDIIGEPLVIHNIGDEAFRDSMVKELVNLVGLDVRCLRRYPHSFSGGQRQRIGIARALALRPDILICDEPVSALDVSVQAQILNLLRDLRSELNLTYIFISHNLAVVDYLCDRIAVMCAGRLVELAPRDLLFRNPVHPYTQALFAAVPYPDPDHPLDLSAIRDRRMSEPGEWPDPFAIAPDAAKPSRFRDIGDGHYVRYGS